MIPAQQRRGHKCKRASALYDDTAVRPAVELHAASSEAYCAVADTRLPMLAWTRATTFSAPCSFVVLGYDGVDLCMRLRMHGSCGPWLHRYLVSCWDIFAFWSVPVQVVLVRSSLPLLTPLRLFVTHIVPMVIIRRCCAAAPWHATQMVAVSEGHHSMYGTAGPFYLLGESGSSSQ